MGVIDFSLYLRTAITDTYANEKKNVEKPEMAKVLDQKNYIEELNRHLK